MANKYIYESINNLVNCLDSQKFTFACEYYELDVRVHLRPFSGTALFSPTFLQSPVIYMLKTKTDPE